MLYFAVSLCTETVDHTVEIVADKRIVELAITNIDDIYRQIKKNEESPNTDYLFAGLEKQNTFAMLKGLRPVISTYKKYELPTKHENNWNNLFQ